MPQKIDRATIHAAGFNYQGIARLKPGVTIEQANADVERLLPSLTERFPLPPGFTKKMFDDARFGSLVRPLDVDVVGDIGNMLWILLGTVGLVLLVACANVANLFLVRAEARQQELAIRLALGAEARRVAWQLMSESLLVALIGGVLGIALAYGGIQLLLYLQPAQLPRLNEITLDPIVLLFTLGISLVAGLLFGAIPILKYARPHMASALKDSSRGSSEGRERHRARNTLVVAQVALAAVLLVASGLMVRTFIAIRDVPPGFQQSREHPDAAHLDSIGGRQRSGADGAHARTDRAQARSDRRRRVGRRDLRGHDGRQQQQRSDLGRGLSAAGRRHPAAAPPQVHRRRLLRDDGQSGDRRARDRRGTTSTPGRRSRSSARTSRASTGASPRKALGKRIRRSTKSPWYEIVGVVGNERQDGATKPSPTIVYWPMLNGDKTDPQGHLRPALAGLRRFARRACRSPGSSAKCNRRCGASIPTCRSRACGRCSRSTTSRWRRRSSCW